MALIDCTSYTSNSHNFIVRGPAFLCSSLSEAFLCSPRHHKGILKEPKMSQVSSNFTKVFEVQTVSARHGCHEAWLPWLPLLPWLNSESWHILAFNIANIAKLCQGAGGLHLPSFSVSSEVWRFLNGLNGSGRSVFPSLSGWHGVTVCPSQHSLFLALSKSLKQHPTRTIASKFFLPAAPASDSFFAIWGISASSNSGYSCKPPLITCRTTYFTVSRCFHFPHLWTPMIFCRNFVAFSEAHRMPERRVPCFPAVKRNV